MLAYTMGIVEEPLVRHATSSDVPQIAGVIARAFDDDPFINFIVKQDRRRERRIQDWARGAAVASVALGETYVTEAGDGAALWTPPGSRTPLASSLVYDDCSR
jgi:hypothetical protein